MNSQKITPIEEAREIMGTSIFETKHAKGWFDYEAYSHESKFMETVPWGRTQLEGVSKTHALVAVFPVSVVDILVFHGNLFSENHWYKEKRFANHRPRLGWRLIRKAPVPDSFQKSWNEQLALLKPDDLMPSTQEMVYTIIGLHLAQGELLFPNVLARALDFGADHYQVHVGNFVGPLQIEQLWDNPRAEDRGLASQKNPHFWT